MIKPTYSVSFLLSIIIVVWQNVLYLPNDLRIKFLKHIQRSSVIWWGGLDKGRSTDTIKLLLESECGNILTLRIVVDCQLKMTFLPSGVHVNIRLDHLLPPKRNKCPYFFNKLFSFLTRKGERRVVKRPCTCHYRRSGKSAVVNVPWLYSLSGQCVLDARQSVRKQRK